MLLIVNINLSFKLSLHEIAPGGGSKSIQLDHDSKPHNPMINTGSILMSTLFGRDKSAPERKVSIIFLSRL